MNRLLPVIAASLVLLATACNNDPYQQEKAGIVSENNFEEISADTTGIPAHHTQNAQNNDWDKKIIKNATLNLEVEDYKQYNNTLHQDITKWQGYISGEEESSSEYKIENVITIKIPVQYFDEAIQQLSSSGKLMVKQVHSQDVTSDYYDTRVRMEARKKIGLRYLELLRQSKNMEEILQVEKEINAIQEQIEAAEGRVNYLNHAAAYSTIQLTFFKVLNSSAVDPVNPGFAKRIQLAMYAGLQWIGDVIVVLVTLWPLWIALGMGIWIIRKITSVKVIQRKVD